MIVYTVNIGGYDHTKHLEGFEGYYVTDQKAPEGWEEIKIDNIWGLPNAAIAKLVKIKPEMFFDIPDGETIVYHDANLIPKNLEEFVDKHESDFSVFKHGSDFSIYKELDLCKNHRRKYINVPALDKQGEYYINASCPNMPYPTVLNCVIIRRNNLHTRRLSTQWWQDIAKHQSWRDQPSLRYVLYLDKQDINLIPHEDKKKYFGSKNHVR